jgi:hypothetical protein
VPVRIYDAYDPDCQARARVALDRHKKTDLVDLVMIQEEREASQIESMEKVCGLIASGRIAEAHASLQSAVDAYRGMHVDRCEFWFGSKW